jgi:arginine deiminase
MYYPVRQGETHNIAAIYKFHPLFTENLKVWQDCSEGTGGVPSIEGGDVLVISPECVLIGLSERTAPAAVERLVRKLFEENVVQRVIGIEVPKKRACMHLDTVMTMIDHETFCVAFPTEQIRSWTMMPGDKPGQLNVVENGNVFDSIASTLGIKKLRLLSPSGDVFARSREQWTDASNLLAVRPGVVVAYDRNVKTNKLLKENGIEVLGIPGSELGRGRGGARCMSCSLERE